MSYRKGSKVWLEDKDSAWVEAEVVDVKDKLVVVFLPLQRKKVACFFSLSSFLGSKVCSILVRRVLHFLG